MTCGSFSGCRREAGKPDDVPSSTRARRGFAVRSVLWRRWLARLSAQRRDRRWTKGAEVAQQIKVCMRIRKLNTRSRHCDDMPHFRDYCSSDQA